MDAHTKWFPPFASLLPSLIRLSSKTYSRICKDTRFSPFLHLLYFPAISPTFWHLLCPSKVTKPGALCMLSEPGESVSPGSVLSRWHPKAGFETSAFSATTGLSPKPKQKTRNPANPAKEAWELLTFDWGPSWVLLGPFVAPGSKEAKAKE